MTAFVAFRSVPVEQRGRRERRVVRMITASPGPWNTNQYHDMFPFAHRWAKHNVFRPRWRFEFCGNKKMNTDIIAGMWFFYWWDKLMPIIFKITSWRGKIRMKLCMSLLSWNCRGAYDHPNLQVHGSHLRSGKTGSAIQVEKSRRKCTRIFLSATACPKHEGPGAKPERSRLEGTKKE